MHMFSFGSYHKKSSKWSHHSKVPLAAEERSSRSSPASGTVHPSSAISAAASGLQSGLHFAAAGCSRTSIHCTVGWPLAQCLPVPAFLLGCHFLICRGYHLGSVCVCGVLELLLPFLTLSCFYIGLSPHEHRAFIAPVYPPFSLEW